MKTICISASLRFKEDVRVVIDALGQHGVRGVFPNLDSGLTKDDLDEKTLRRLESDHFDAIHLSNALYVIDPGGYIGTLVKIEIGYALGKSKPVYFSQETGELELDVLARGFVPIESVGQLAHLVDEEVVA